MLIISLQDKENNRCKRNTHTHTHTHKNKDNYRGWDLNDFVVHLAKILSN